MGTDDMGPCGYCDRPAGFLRRSHIYFAGGAKRFRVRHDRVVTLEPYSDGGGILRDGVRAKPETFELGDGWSACNLLRNIEVPP